MTRIDDPIYFLLVDDLEENLLSLEALLKRPGLVLLKARSGHEALELLLKYEIALALLDVQMPGMDGFGLAELMRGTERTRRVPIIFLTAGSADHSRRFRGYEAGAVDFLQKPIESDILRSKANVFFALYRQQQSLKVTSEENARLLEESRIYALALQEADRRKDEFLANMSHEIRTPMNAVVGLANILALSEPLTDRQREFIATLQTSAESLLALINDMLDLSKIESSTVELEHVPFSVVQVVQETVSMMQLKAQEKGLAMGMDVACACVDTRVFLGDPARLRQILLNLSSNALKFTDKGGVTLTVSCEAIDATHERIAIAVTDTGIGIPPEKLDAVFQKFVQADSSISRKYGGTGLGLTITKMLAEMMGGTIDVQSETGKGSTFTVSIPLEIEAGRALPSAPMLDPRREKSTSDSALVLLVEDHPPNILVARTFLEEFGYRVEIATNGIDAVEMATRQRYHAVLMDVQMHGMNGFDATQRIREFEAQQSLPPMQIIGMTAHALIGDRERCIQAGMNDYITKPFVPDELEYKLQRIQR